MTQLTENEFMDQYNPVALFGDGEYVTDDKSLAEKYWRENYQVFSIVEDGDIPGDESLYIEPGFHHINLHGYIVCHNQLTQKAVDEWPGAVWMKDEKIDFTFTINPHVSITEHAYHPGDAWREAQDNVPLLKDMPMPEWTSNEPYTAPMERTFTFKLTLTGTGISESIAWNDAVDSFTQDPGTYDESFWESDT